MSCSNKKTSKPSVIQIMNLETKMIACLWIIFTLVNVAFGQPNFYTHGRYGKREETLPTDQLNFNFGSRYGRGEKFELKATNENDEKSNEIMARVDRFFLGSRYGKRGTTNNLNDNSTEKFIYLNNIRDALRYYYRLRREAKQLSSDDMNTADKKNGNFINNKPSLSKADSAEPMNSE
ncbi:uncharacterized protein LOC130664840 [Microplitis mediator]|uniref:uncharacterized protein LOC130664840 n=1 Tax=Microplitis mediator TaxID=375433 RepID=UPI00255648B0|nr:uncharacterized protein LOC130664840 [Microplitis mediator]XP_057320958.1 uncharacterized protein LOC130664840 [Microplitis mediator]XP_057320959.1 uncharacterized protein LOC130664840 [Microplitis mediator]